MIMATPIKAIPTLYGEDAKRFGEAALKAELNYDPSKKEVYSEKRKNARAMLKKAGLICLIAIVVAGCGGKKGGSSQSSKAKAQTEVNGKAKGQSEVRGKSERPETRQEKLQKQYKKDSERLEKLHKEYRELLLKVTNTPDPRERERISDRMDRINREAEELQSKMYRLYGRMY